MNDNYIYLDTYVLQQDMRIRMPKAILENLDVKKGVTKFDILFDKNNEQIILRKSNNEEAGK